MKLPSTAPLSPCSLVHISSISINPGDIASGAVIAPA